MAPLAAIKTSPPYLCTATSASIAGGVRDSGELVAWTRHAHTCPHIVNPPGGDLDENNRIWTHAFACPHFIRYPPGRKQSNTPGRQNKSYESRCLTLDAWKIRPWGNCFLKIRTNLSFGSRQMQALMKSIERGNSHLWCDCLMLYHPDHSDKEI